MMARYFMHLRDGSDETLDPEGHEYPDMAALQKRVLECARDLIAGDVHEGRIDLGYRIDAEDDQGAVVYTLEFQDAVSIQRQHA